MRDHRMEVDTESLTKLYGTIPQALKVGMLKIQEALQRQPDSVQKVTFLPNFGQDTIASLRRGSPVYTGFRVDMKDDYQLGPEDACWLHPTYGHLTRMRAGGGEDKAVSLPMYDACAGVYEVHSVDPVLGSPVKEAHTIIQLHTDRGIDHWMDGTTLADAYAQCRSENWKEQVKATEASLAEDLGAGEIEHEQWQHLFQRGEGTMSYFSGCTQRSGNNLVHISPLLGYIADTGSNQTVPGNMFSHSNVIDVSSLDLAGQRRIWETATWDGETMTNPFVMQHPLDGWQSALSGEHLTMGEAQFSSCADAVDLMKPGAIVRMTPDAHCAYTKEEDAEMSKVRLLATEPLLTHLLKSRDSLNLLSSEVYDGTYLKLERGALTEAIKNSDFAF